VSDDRGFLKRFFDNFGKVPEEEPKELIPHDIRIPFFLGLAVVSLILLGLLLWFVVIPAISAQQTAAPLSQAPGQLTASGA
jgi:hypothetical protein